MHLQSYFIRSCVSQLGIYSSLVSSCSFYNEIDINQPADDYSITFILSVHTEKVSE